MSDSERPSQALNRMGPSLVITERDMAATPQDVARMREELAFHMQNEVDLRERLARAEGDKDVLARRCRELTGLLHAGDPRPDHDASDGKTHSYGDDCPGGHWPCDSCGYDPTTGPDWRGLCERLAADVHVLLGRHSDECKDLARENLAAYDAALAGSKGTRTTTFPESENVPGAARGRGPYRRRHCR